MIPARVTTWRRWWHISALSYSLYRALEYERLAGLVLPGRTLDIGGGRRTSYLHLLDVRGQLHSLNIDSSVEPSAVADFNRPLPFPDAVFDDVLTLNTLEHVYDEDLAIREIVRVLKPGGRFHIGVPFLYRVHGSPDDYNRHTASWWYRRLLTLEVDADSIVVEPLVWDPVASAFSLVEFTRFRRLLKKPALLPGLLSDRSARRQGRRTQHHARRNADFALGYFVTGRRRGDGAVPAIPAPAAQPDRRRLSLMAVRSVARRILDGVRLAEHPTTFAVQSLLDQRRLLTSRRAADFRYRSLRFSARPSDWNAVREVLIDGEYDVVDELLDGISPTVVDLGANIGTFSLRVFATSPRAVVHSYEPDPDTFAMLEGNRAKNAHLAWTCYRAAAHAASGTVRFRAAATSTAGRVASEGCGEEVPSASLQEILTRTPQEQIDLMKVDIEGSEQALLAGTPELLTRVRHLIVEVHPHLVDADAVVRTLREAFPFLHRVPGRGSSKPLLVAARRPLPLPAYP